MRSLARLVFTVAVVATGPVLSACSSASLDSLDPSEWFDTKKKINGERRPVFPDGVPGVTSGVPAELVRGYREPEGGEPDPAKAAAEAAAGADHPPPKPPPQHTATIRKPRPNSNKQNNNNTRGAGQQPPPQQAPPASPPGGWPAPQQTAPWPGAH